MSSALLSRIALALGALALPGGLQAQIVGGGFRTYVEISTGTAGEQIGSTLAVIDDIDADGLPDLAIGGQLADPNGLIDAGIVLLVSGTTGAVIHRLEGQEAGEQFGFDIADAGDIDGDGVGDVIVGIPIRTVAGNKINAGAIAVYSGATGLEIMYVPSAKDNQYVGSAVEGGEDLNGDGTPDLVVTALHGQNPIHNIPGYVAAISGVDGSTLWVVWGEEDHSHMGHSLDFFDDIDGDGVEDIAVTIALKTVAGKAHIGALRVVSGATGATLYEVDGDGFPHAHFGISAGVAGDMDGDGYNDILVGAPRADLVGLVKSGYARAYSGFDGTMLAEWQGTQDEQEYGLALAGCGDVDHDGHDDVILGAFSTDVGNNPDAGSVFVFSGKDYTELARFDGANNRDSYGSAAAGPVDFDGDGVLDYAIGSMGANDVGGVLEAGRVFIDGYHPSLTIDDSVLEAANGDSVTLNIDFPDTEAGMEYWTFFSLSGTGPSMWSGVTLPLTQDGLFVRTRNGFYPQGATAMTGTLDGNGDAVGSLTFAPGELSNFVGTIVYGAVMSFELGSGGRASSAAISVEIAL